MTFKQLSLNRAVLYMPITTNEKVDTIFSDFLMLRENSISQYCPIKRTVLATDSTADSFHSTLLNIQQYAIEW